MSIFRFATVVLLFALLFDMGAAQQVKDGPRATHFSKLIERPFQQKPSKPKKVKPAAEEEKWEELPRIEPKVVGGKDATQGAYPWVVALLSSGEPDNYQAQFCGGTLVHPYWVVTSAHCLESSVPAEIEVLLGGYDLQNNAQGVRVAVEEIIIHPDYKTTNADVDIALLRLATPADPAYTPLPIADDPGLSAPGVVARILGWGDTTGDGVYPSTLQEADMPLVDLTVANATVAYDGTLLDTMLAAGYPEGGIDSCGGDSGGPLVVPAPTASGWALAGVTSFGAGCALPDSYGIYARVDGFRSFLIEYLYPGYSAWEREYGVAGEWRYAPGSNLDRFAQYALRRSPLNDGGTRPLSVIHAANGGEQALRVPVLSDRREVDYFLGWSPDLVAWTDVPLEGRIVSEAPLAGDPAGSEVVATSGQSASLPKGFMQVLVAPSSVLVPGPRELKGSGRAQGALTDDDEVHPDFAGRRMKLYRLTEITAGTPYRLVCRSTDFDVRIELLDASNTASPLQVADFDTAGGTDEELIFTASAGVDYLLRVTSSADGELGGFMVGAYLPGVFQALPALTVTASLAGRNAALSNTDALDTLWDPEIIYCDDYRLVAAAGEYVRIDMTTTAFDTLLEVIDEETGLIVTMNDDGPDGTNSRVEFLVAEGRAYRIRATSIFREETGSYSLSHQTVDPPPAISVPDTVFGALDINDPFDPNFQESYYADDYILTGVSDGQDIYVAVAGDGVALDTYLYLIDADTGAILLENDEDGAGPSSRIDFTVNGSTNYLIRVSTYDPLDTGDYVLSTGFN